MNKYSEIIELLSGFINQQRDGINRIKAMESALDDLGLDNEFIDNLSHDLALYNPSGGAHYLDYQAFLPKAKKALEYFEHQVNITA